MQLIQHFLQIIARIALGPLWQGVLLVACCYVIPLLDLFAMVIQGLVTLRQGMQKGFIVTVGGASLGAVLGFVAFGFITEVSFESLASSLLWVLSLALPFWLIAGLLRRTVSLALTMQIMTLFFMMLFIASFIADISIFPDYFRVAIIETARNLVSNIAEAQQTANLDAELVLTTEKIENITSFLVNLFEIISIYSMYTIFLISARAWQSALFMPGGFKKDFVQLKAGYLITTIFVCFWLLILIKPGTNLTYALLGAELICAIWLFIIGLSYVHWLIYSFNLSIGILVFFYLLLVLPIVSSIVVFMLIIIGLIDGFYDLRSYANRFNSGNS